MGGKQRITPGGRPLSDLDLFDVLDGDVLSAVRIVGLDDAGCYASPLPTPRDDTTRRWCSPRSARQQRFRTVIDRVVLGVVAGVLKALLQQGPRRWPRRCPPRAHRPDAGGKRLRSSSVKPWTWGLGRDWLVRVHRVQELGKPVPPGRRRTTPMDTNRAISMSHSVHSASTPCSSLFIPWVIQVRSEPERGGVRVRSVFASAITNPYGAGFSGNGCVGGFHHTPILPPFPPLAVPLFLPTRAGNRFPGRRRGWCSAA